MRAFLFVAFPLALAGALYIFAIAPAIGAIESLGASIATPAQQGR